MPPPQPGPMSSLLATTRQRQIDCGSTCQRERIASWLAPWSTLCLMELTLERSRGWKWESATVFEFLNLWKHLSSAAFSLVKKKKLLHKAILTQHNYFQSFLLLPLIKSNWELFLIHFHLPFSVFFFLSSPAFFFFFWFLSLVITVWHQRAAGWWKSCRLPCQPKVSSTFFHVGAGWLKTEEMVWLPDFLMCWMLALSTLSAKWVTQHLKRLVCCTCEYTSFLCCGVPGHIFSDSCHGWHPVCRDWYQHIPYCVWSQWEHRGNAAA